MPKPAKTVTFTTTILSMGNNTGIEVPPKIVEGFGATKRPPVKVTVGGHTYQSTVAVMGGKYLISLSAANRKAAGVEGGDKVKVTLEFETAPRIVELPADFAKALAKVPAAKKFYDGLAPSMKKFHVTNIEGAKTDETRARRIAKSVEMLKDGRAR
jgi:Uncharacterized protein conserved in bacteria